MSAIFGFTATLRGQADGRVSRLVGEGLLLLDLSRPL